MSLQHFVCSLSFKQPANRMPYPAAHTTPAYSGVWTVSTYTACSPAGQCHANSSVRRLHGRFASISVSCSPPPSLRPERLANGKTAELQFRGSTIGNRY